MPRPGNPALYALAYASDCAVVRIFATEIAPRLLRGEKKIDICRQLTEAGVQLPRGGRWLPCRLTKLMHRLAEPCH